MGCPRAQSGVPKREISTAVGTGSGVLRGEAMLLEEGRVEYLLKAFPVVIEITVAWGEMDALKHVNNVVYFRYFENVRIAYFERLQYWEFMHKTGIGPILASTKCRFMAPLTFPDRVFAGTRISDLGKDRFVMDYCLVSERLQKVAAEGEAVLVSYNYRENKKVPLPEELKKRIVELEDSARTTASRSSLSQN
jgi:acyl-CoA thioester hydrolase